MIESLSLLGLATVVVASLHPVLMNALHLVLHQQMAVQLERERRVTLIGVLARVRPGIWVLEHHETGYQRLVGQFPRQQAPPEQPLIHVGGMQ